MVMTGQGATSAHEAVPDRVSIWRWLSIAAAVLAVAGSVTALYVDSIYARLTPTFLPMALAQDIANLALASLALLILAALALRGCLRAYLLWLGVLTFTVTSTSSTRSRSRTGRSSSCGWRRSACVSLR
jgi:hypothetical protein